MIDHKRHFIFIHIPKTAGVSIYKALGRTDEQNHKTRRDYKERYFSFAFVRNPWDRLVSTYSYVRQGGRGFRGDLYAQSVIENMSFADFVANLPDVHEKFSRFDASGNGRYTHGYPHLLPQRHWTHASGKLIIDFVGRYETLVSDFGEICAKISVNAQLSNENTSKREPDYRKYYSDVTADEVLDFYRSDVETYNYSF